MKDFRFAAKSVVSVSSVCGDEELANAIRLSDRIRNETLNRCLAIPSYRFKSLDWKNRYYDVIRYITPSCLAVALSPYLLFPESGPGENALVSLFTACRM